MVKKKEKKSKAKVEEELIVEVCEVEEEACDGYKAIRDISRQYRKGDLVPKAVVAKWEKMGIVISELVE